jgi:hypothetical protein
MKTIKFLAQHLGEYSSTRHSLIKEYDCDDQIDFSETTTALRSSDDWALIYVRKDSEIRRIKKLITEKMKNMDIDTVEGECQYNMLFDLKKEISK